MISKLRDGIGCPIPSLVPLAWFSKVLAEHTARLNLYARPHGGGNRNALDVGALGASRLRLGDRIRERLDVLHQLLFRERRLADPGLNDSGLLDPEFDRTALGAFHGGGDVHGD